MKRLSSRRILLVEDDPLLACALKAVLVEAGAHVLGPAGTVTEALDLVAGEEVIDAALLDVDLAGSFVFPVADALIARAVPFMLTSGTSMFEMPTAYWHIPREDKPYCAVSLALRLAAMCAASDHAILPPFVVAEAAASPLL